MTEAGGKPKILIGVPNLGQIGTPLQFRIRQWEHSKKYVLTIIEATGFRPLEVAVNTIIKQFLETDAEYLFLINADEHLPQDGIDRLLAHDVDCVVPLGLRWDARHGPMPCVGIRDGGTSVAKELARHFEEPEDTEARVIPYQPLYIQPKKGYSGLRACDRTGNSGMLVKRHVMESIPLGTFHVDMSEDRCSIIATEDYVMTDTMRAMGFDVYVDCSLLLDHYKDVNLKTVKQLMVMKRLEGQEDTVRALQRLQASGATDSEAIAGLMDWLEERRRHVSSKGDR